MTSLFALNLSSQALQALSLTESISEKHYIAVVPVGVSPWIVSPSYYCAFGTITKGPYSNQLLCMFKSDQKYECSNVLADTIQFKPTDDFNGLLKTDQIYALCFGLQSTIDIFLGVNIGDILSYVGFKEISSTPSISACFEKASKARKPKSKLPAVIYKNKGALTYRASEKAARVWMCHHAPTYVSIDQVPQRNQRAEGLMHRFRVYNERKKTFKTVRTLQECLCLVETRVGRYFHNDIATNPEVYDLHFEDKDFECFKAKPVKKSDTTPPPKLLFDATIA